ncbi:MAG TPA: alpha/beta fold hydrolase [Longimicrobiales bacterium]|nr:alpha/beta fold hydrolase [Longimicrobiales bacterium]
MATLRHRVRRFRLESGRELEDVAQAYTFTGELNEARDNLVLVFHSLTGGPDPREAWPDLIGPGLPIDTTRYAVLSTNLLGSCYGTTRPPGDAVVTPRDMAALVRPLVEDLGVRSVALATGGSLGGMVTLEWVASFPELTRAAVAFAAPGAHTAQAIGLNHVQRKAIQAGGAAGLELARMLAMLTYRTPGELEARFGRERRDDGVFQVQSYLSYQGEKLRRRFDPLSYLMLLDAMDAHDVGAGRGGVAAALGPVADRVVGVGITGDLLYSPDDVLAWTSAAGASYREIRSAHGHDAFLLEPDQVAAILTEALDGAAEPPPVSRRGATAGGSA